MTYEYTEEEAAYWRRRLQAQLDAAWIRRCGLDDKPGRWIGPECLEVDEVEGCEVSVYPTQCGVQNGEPRVWASHLTTPGFEIVPAWQWRIALGWEELKDGEEEQFEELGMCLDANDMVCHVRGDHQKKPPIPDNLVKAVALVGNPPR